MKNTKFSVIIPVYNAVADLSHCLESIAEQTYENFEVILVDDGSTDGSLDLCHERAAADNRLKVVTQSNAGVSAARNNGIRHATGDYVMFMDDDDEWCDKKGLAQIAVQLQESKADILLFDTLKNGKNDSTLTLDRGEILGQTPNTALVKLITNDKLTRAVWSKVIKRHLITVNHVYFPEGRRNEDFAFTAELIKYAQSYDWCNLKFYNWRVGGESQSARRLSLSVLQDSFFLIQESLANSAPDIEESYTSYIAYPYAVLLGQCQEASMRGITGTKEIIRRLRAYRYLLKENLNPMMKKISLAYNLIGYYPTVWLLGLGMALSYRKQGV